jgi:hypothetical protein
MYVLEPRDDGFFVIVHENCNCTIGYVSKRGNRYQVARSYWHDEVDIATVNSLDEAIRVFTAHYERHPPTWERVNEARYTKDTHFGGLDVKRDEQGSWVASRGIDCALLRDGKPARFATRQEAQRLADLHEDEDFANSVRINDGYRWEVDPGVDEYLAERRRTRTGNGRAAAA